MSPVRPLHIAALLLILGGSLALGGCGRGDDEVSRVAAIGDTPSLIDTVTRPLTAGEALVRSNVAQGLVRFDARGQVVPGLAERWNVSDDGLSYIFRLQTGEWPDGRKLKADEIAAILSRQLRSSSSNPLRDTLGAVDEVVAMTDRVIEIRLKAPRPNLLQLLAQPEFGLVRASVGTGPFLPATVDAADPRSLVIEHRLVIPDAKNIRERVILTGGPAHSLVTQFKQSRIEMVIGGTFDDLPPLRDADLGRSALRFDPVIGLFGLRPNPNSQLAQDRELRRLISRAINRRAIVAQLRVPGLQPRATVLQSGLEGTGEIAQPDWLNQGAADRVVQLKAEANRIFGSVERPTIRIDLPQGPGGELVIRQIARDLQVIGIQVGRAATPQTADFLWVDEVAPSSSPAWFLRQFSCTGPGICVDGVNAILKDAREAMSGRDRSALLLAAATQIDEAQLFIPIAAPVRWSLVAPSISGFIENPFGRHTLVGLKNRRAREE